MQEPPCEPPEYMCAPKSIKDRLARFNNFADSHQKKQELNPFSTDKNVSGLQKRRFSKEEYGRPEKGSKSELRGFKASLEILKEMLQLCEVINKHAEPLFTPKEKKIDPRRANDPRKVISFGELFSCAPKSIKDRLARFNNFADSHQKKQELNPFSTDKNVSGLQKRRFSKEEYGRPEKGSKSELRGFKASLEILKEMLQLCEVINKHAEPLFTPKEKKIDPRRANDPRKVISFGELFSIYTTISSKLVGILLRGRKQKLVDFEGEVLFQRRDDDVPIILLKPIEEIRQILNAKINELLVLLHVNEPPIEDLLEEER